MFQKNLLVEKIKLYSKKIMYTTLNKIYFMIFLRKLYNLILQFYTNHILFYK